MSVAWLYLQNFLLVIISTGSQYSLDDHKRMNEYKTEYRKVENRNCEKHPGKVYSVSCRKCNDVACVRCSLRPGTCSTEGKGLMGCIIITFVLYITVRDDDQIIAMTKLLRYHVYNQQIKQ